jgi:hypothetical protein
MKRQAARNASDAHARLLGKAAGTPADLMAREDNGRFAAGFERLCTCGHTLGVHAAANPRSCFAGDFDPTVDCDCERFRAARRAVKGGGR